ncbi:hypothetical protein AB0442_33200 [Kitasatospora sp. NPDC085895]|uniref:hypothetical protein n=1 Tax=Kitasatospora sp. NPDC085895 TaxID=3155057 RepID=UPI00344F2ECA
MGTAADTWPATGRTEYRGIGARAAAVFDTTAGLPGQVFAAPPGEVLFCEFDAVLTEEFWPALRDMARWHGDDRRSDDPASWTGTPPS